MTVLLALILSADAFAISASYKLRSIAVPMLSKLIICIMSFISTISALYVGKAASFAFSDAIADVLGCGVLIFCGLFIIIGTATDNPEKCDKDGSKQLEPKEAVVMGVILSADSFFSGIALGFIKTPAFVFAIVAAVSQFLFFVLGEVSAKFLKKSAFKKEKTLQILSGLLLMSIAVIKLLSYVF